LHISYIHGYSDRETKRLHEQALILEDIFTFRYILSRRYFGARSRMRCRCANPDTKITSIDISEESLKIAQYYVENGNFRNITFRTMDVTNLSFDNNRFDHVFVCFLMEHIEQPGRTHGEISRVPKPGGTITVITGYSDIILKSPSDVDPIKKN
jgi:SAM-dependent methyltransferase